MRLVILDVYHHAGRSLGEYVLRDTSYVAQEGDEPLSCPAPDMNLELRDRVRGQRCELELTVLRGRSPGSYKRPEYVQESQVNAWRSAECDPQHMQVGETAQVDIRSEMGRCSSCQIDGHYTSRGLTVVEDKCSPWTLPTRSAAGSSKCGTSMSKHDNATPRLDMRISTARISICRTWRREICVSGVHDAEPRRRSPQTHNELLQPVQRDLFGSTRLERQRRYARRRPSHSYAKKLDKLGCGLQGSGKVGEGREGQTFQVKVRETGSDVTEREGEMRVDREVWQRPVVSLQPLRLIERAEDHDRVQLGKSPSQNEGQMGDNAGRRVEKPADDI